jgi:hypothetical protein
MYLQIAKNDYRSAAPPIAGANGYFYKNRTPPQRSETAEFEPAGISLPVLATANDLREVVKFFKHKPHGVSVIEMSSAEPRRVFEARKIAAYEFWGILTRADERFRLTALGEELAKNTEAECAIHRRILRGVPAYESAVRWIFEQGLKIATFREVADFWTFSGENLDLSPQNEENIEAVIVSFFSLCHAAELGTATVGKRGQPARLSVRLDQLSAFLDASSAESPENAAEPSKVFTRKSVLRFDPENVESSGERIATVYISAGRCESETANLCAALELADFASLTFGDGGFENGFLPRARRDALKQCQAAIFLLDDADCRARANGEIALICERVTEISVAEALFGGERVILLWTGAAEMPEAVRAAGFNTLGGDVADWASNIKLVKCLKSLKI